MFKINRCLIKKKERIENNYKKKMQIKAKQNL